MLLFDSCTVLQKSRENENNVIQRHNQQLVRLLNVFERQNEGFRKLLSTFLFNPLLRQLCSLFGLFYLAAAPLPPFSGCSHCFAAITWWVDFGQKFAGML